MARFVRSVRRRRNPLRRRRIRRYARRVPRPLTMRRRLNMYHYKQAVDGSLISVGFFANRLLSQTNAFQSQQIVCTLADLPQAATFTSLYDQYRINKIIIKFVPMTSVQSSITATYGVTAGAGTLGAVNNPGLIGTVVDTDGNPTIASWTQAEQYATFKSYPVIRGKTIFIKCVPGTMTGVQHAGGALASEICKKKQWLDCGDATVNHFVGGWLCDPYGAQGVSTAQTWQIMAYYYVSFRNTR